MISNIGFPSKGELKMRNMLLKITGVLFILMLVNGRVHAGDQKVSKHFEEITTKTPELYAFLRAMPKGGDLHSHMVGSAYSEEYIEWGIKEKMCVELATKRITRTCRTNIDHAQKNQKKELRK